MPNERLRDALFRNGVTPEQIACSIQVDPKTVERWITKGRTPYSRHRHALAAIVKESERYLWPDAITPEQATEIGGSEVIKVYPHRNSIPVPLWDRLIDNANERIEILVHAGLFLIERPAFIKDMAEKAANGTHIRFLFGDPGSRQVAIRSEEEQLGKGTLAARIHNALAYYQSLRETDGVAIRFHKTTLYNSIFRFDNEMIVNTHVYGFQGAHAPALHLRRLSVGNLFERYSESFEIIWAQSAPATFRD